jgi:cell wall-associated NlpC family hydrolase
MVITVSDVDGIRQYSAPKALKKIVIITLLLLIAIVVGTFYYIQTLNAKVTYLTSNNESLTQITLKDKSIRESYEQHEEELEGIKKELLQAEVKYEKEKLVLVENYKVKMEALIGEKNSIATKNKLTLKQKREKEKLLDALTKEIKNIEKELTKETKQKERLQKKLSLKKKLKKVKLKKEKDRKEKLAKQKLKREKLLERIAKSKLGKRYVWGAIGPKVFDCSGFTSYVYKKAGVNLPRTSIIQSKYGKYIKRKDLKAGDLIFFDTSRNRKGYVNHVGIYLGNNKFIHASSAKKKVVISSLGKAFYSGRYKWARRVR